MLVHVNAKYRNTEEFEFRFSLFVCNTALKFKQFL